MCGLIPLVIATAMALVEVFIGDTLFSRSWDDWRVHHNAAATPRF
jgi:hypothetical protein